MRKIGIIVILMSLTSCTVLFKRVNHFKPVAKELVNQNETFIEGEISKNEIFQLRLFERNQFFVNGELSDIPFRDFYQATMPQPKVKETSFVSKHKVVEESYIILDGIETQEKGICMYVFTYPIMAWKDENIDLFQHQYFDNPKAMFTNTFKIIFVGTWEKTLPKGRAEIHNQIPSKDALIYDLTLALPLKTSTSGSYKKIKEPQLIAGKYYQNAKKGIRFISMDRISDIDVVKNKRVGVQGKDLIQINEVLKIDKLMLNQELTDFDFTFYDQKDNDYYYQKLSKRVNDKRKMSLQHFYLKRMFDEMGYVFFSIPESKNIVLNTEHYLNLKNFDNPEIVFDAYKITQDVKNAENKHLYFYNQKGAPFFLRTR